MSPNRSRRPLDQQNHPGFPNPTAEARLKRTGFRSESQQGEEEFAQEFSPEQRDRAVRMVCDRQKLWFCYTTFITVDITRRILGWAVATSLQTEVLRLQALEQALQITPAGASRTGPIHHSGRGTNDVSWG